MLGSDIGCALKKTIARSRVAASFGSSICITNAWHGFMHIRSCQVSNHPYYTTGVGLSELEDVERHFSASNHVASLTRHTTKFHRLQYIDLHYRYADAQKYAALGRFIYENYCQALTIIAEESGPLNEMEIQHGFTGNNYAQWLDEERHYLETAGKEPESEKLTSAYLAAYDAWQVAE